MKLFTWRLEGKRDQKENKERSNKLWSENNEI